MNILHSYGGTEMYCFWVNYSAQTVEKQCVNYYWVGYAVCIFAM